MLRHRLSHRSCAIVGLGLWLCVVVAIGSLSRADEKSQTASDSTRQHPLSNDERARLKKQWDDGIAELTQKLQTTPDDIASLNRRGDLHFFRGEFDKAVADYELACQRKPELEPAHWQLGIAYYYADQPAKCSKLFERFFQIDDVDRECGLWKFLGDAKVSKPAKAREQLLKYTKGDREPMLSIYRLFDGTTSASELLDSFRQEKLSDPVREQRSFYIELYLGLWHDAHGRTKEALPHLHSATANRWPRTAGYGPNYMWHVARVHYELLAGAK